MIVQLIELFNLLVNPSTHSFALRWHRDDVFEGASEEEEFNVLNSSHYGVSHLQLARRCHNRVLRSAFADPMEHVSLGHKLATLTFDANGIRAHP